VINALLGEKFLADGILPTTNEISILRYGDKEASAAPSQSRDGLFERLLPAELLQEVNIVDTPGGGAALTRSHWRCLCLETQAKADSS